jgi:5-methylcytosine-specific restriction endonuclease McrA
MAVYVLNNSYQCISQCSTSRAIMLIRNKRAEVVKYSDRVVKTVSDAMRIPLIIKIFKYVAAYNRKLRFSNKLVWERDNYICQYCGEHIAHRKNLTTDHVIPKSRGGKGVYDNMVTACSLCNSKKANKTPSESGMYPIRKPFCPKISYRMQKLLDDVKGILIEIK